MNAAFLMTSDSSILEYKLRVLAKFFNLDQILKLPTDTDAIQRYYQANRLAYSLFHTFSHQMYMGISRDGRYKKSDLQEAFRITSRYIDQLSATSVVELATGRGATSALLAQKYPDVSFQGMDISPSQLSFATKQSARLPNYHPRLGDYHRLDIFADASVDVVLVIEALCYSQYKELVFQQIGRILKPNGVFIVLDGYSTTPRHQLPTTKAKALTLVERAMAVPQFELYDHVLAKAAKEGLMVISDEDASAFILPTLYRFERLANFFFRLPIITKGLVAVYPLAFTANAIAGYLFPEVIKQGMGSYHITVWQKH